MTALILFVCGILTDLLWVWGAQFAVARRPLACGINNVFYTTICLLVSLHIITSSDFLGLATYVAGRGLGSYLSARP